MAIAAIALLAGCTSDSRKAAEDAARAQALYDQGAIGAARTYISRALAIRDDISDYWLIKAHIALADNDLGGAQDAYVNALQLDKANVEALTNLCQIALATNTATRAEKYADQLAALDPGSVLPNTVRASAAAARGDKEKARQYLDQVLSARPDDSLALIVKARMLADAQDYAGAAKAVEQTIAAPGDPTSRLSMLSAYYQRARDGDGLFRTIVRLAQANPNDVDIQFRYADLLFDRGKNDAANAVIARTMQNRTGDVGAAANALNLWLKQGPDILPADRLVADAAKAPLVLKAAYAQYANETGHPELAITILSGTNLTGAAIQRPEAANAAAVLGYARGLTGDSAGADALIGSVLKRDPAQPVALLARGRLRAAAGDLRGGIEDVRNALAQDGGNVAARLTLADLLNRSGEPVLAETALHDGMDAAGDDPRLPTRLARLMKASGRQDAAAATLADFIKANPLSQRAARIKAG
ncbi:MAG: tetratricopeptide repeat protein [Sphingomonas bacterium]